MGKDDMTRTQSLSVIYKRETISVNSDMMESHMTRETCVLFNCTEIMCTPSETCHHWELNSIGIDCATRSCLNAGIVFSCVFSQTLGRSG